MQRERDAERERLKRIKRMRNGGASNKTNRQQEFDVEYSKTEGRGIDEDGWEIIPDHLMTSSPQAANAREALASDDYFEAQWGKRIVT